MGNVFVKSKRDGIKKSKSRQKSKRSKQNRQDESQKRRKVDKKQRTRNSVCDHASHPCTSPNSCNYVIGDCRRHPPPGTCNSGTQITDVVRVVCPASRQCGNGKRIHFQPNGTPGSYKCQNLHCTNPTDPHCAVCVRSNDACCRKRAGSGIHSVSGRFRSSRASRRSSSPRKASMSKDSVRGMVVYRNGKQEKVRMINQHEESSSQLRNSSTTSESTQQKRARKSAEKTSSEEKVPYVVKKTKKPPEPPPSPPSPPIQVIPSNEKKSFFANFFWDSPLGKKLPIGGPLKWFRPRVPPSEQDLPVTPKPKRTQPPKLRRYQLWTGLKRRFIWKTISRRRSSSRPDGQEASSAPKSVISPTPTDDPSPPRHAPSRQFLWKSPSVKSPSPVDDCNVIELGTPRRTSDLPLPPSQATPPESPEHEEIFQRPGSPFFASRFTWKSGNSKMTKQTWNHSRLGQRLSENNVTPASPRAPKERRFLWGGKGESNGENSHAERGYRNQRRIAPEHKDNYLFTASKRR